jgi:DNA helicase-2/ATP-dependent DNA helicase PcrA
VTVPDAILDGLNPAQREAAMAVRGPVVILAGAGTGKTTAITRRIACQVASGAFPPQAILAVTFTDKAAEELKWRLRALGVEGVEARTFHSASLAQLGRLWPRFEDRPLPEVLDAKGPLIASLANVLPRPYRFVPRRELASEIEWAKNRMVPPERYLDMLEGHEPPIPADLMAGLYARYERRKGILGRLDFEDMLGLAVGLFDRHPEAAAEVHRRFLAFTVDEYQDVNPVQQALLERWLGGRDEVCVVGDDYQTIYSFTGATPSYLLGFRDRFPRARVVKLEENYRSTPQVLAMANLLANRLGGFRKSLRATRPDGPPAALRVLPDAGAETAFVVEEARRLHRSEGIQFEEMAVLYRINARSEPFEEAFAAAGIPYQVRDGEFLRRPGPRAVLQRLRRESGPVVSAVERATHALGYRPDAEPDSAEEATRQADLARLRALAAEFASTHPDGGGIGEFVADLRRRFAGEASARGVNLLTYHRAKGLEFDAVFLPRLLEKELPFRSGRAQADENEERRLLYVGITRARRHLYVTWPLDPRVGRSRFVAELGGPPAPLAEPWPARPVVAPPRPASAGGPLVDALKRWRLDRARADGVPAYVVLHDSTLGSIAERRPRSRQELLTVPGVGPAKLDRYGDDILSVVAGAG